MSFPLKTYDSSLHFERRYKKFYTTNSQDRLAWVFHIRGLICSPGVDPLTGTQPSSRTCRALETLSVTPSASQLPACLNPDFWAATLACPGGSSNHHGSVASTLRLDWRPGWRSSGGLHMPRVAEGAPSSCVAFFCINIYAVYSNIIVIGIRTYKKLEDSMSPAKPNPPYHATECTVHLFGVMRGTIYAKRRRMRWSSSQHTIS